MKELSIDDILIMRRVKAYRIVVIEMLALLIDMNKAILNEEGGMYSHLNESKYNDLDKQDDLIRELRTSLQYGATLFKDDLK